MRWMLVGDPTCSSTVTPNQLQKSCLQIAADGPGLNCYATTHLYLPFILQLLLPELDFQAVLCCCHCLLLHLLLALGRKLQLLLQLRYLPMQ
jgi:hypothetical protein